MTSRGFGDLLRGYRNAAGFSQERLAEKAGISAESVSALERGTRRAPYRETLALLASALDLDDERRSALEAAAERGRARSSRPALADAGLPVRHLPKPATPFIGRFGDVETIVRLLERSRLVTLTGSGGVGKTRVAIEVAAQLSPGRWTDVRFVDLAPIAQPDFIVGAIASALLADRSTDSLDGLIDALRSRTLLAVLDNCEHLVADVALIAAAILQACDGIAFLATSRERLAIGAEIVYRLPSLELPNTATTNVADVRRAAAVELFVGRAQAVDGTFLVPDDEVQRVAAICRQLDGIPLAIELAAARAPALGLQLLEQRLATGRAFFSGPRDVPARQQTMLATITWSYDLLGADERTLFERLSIFSGGFRLDAVENVCVSGRADADGIAGNLASLVEKSLVHAAIGETTRFTMLDSVRFLAFDRLVASTEETAMRRRHAEWMAAFADRIDQTRASMSVAGLRAEVRPELENARSALEWSLGTGLAHDALLAGRIIGGLRTIWLTSGLRPECRRWAELAIGRIDENDHPVIVAPILRALIQATDDDDELARWTERAVPVFERIADYTGLGMLFSHASNRQLRRGDLASAERSTDRAARYFQHERADRRMPYAAFLQNRSAVLLGLGRYDEALADSEAQIAIHRAYGDDGGDVAYTSLAEVHYVMGNTEEAARQMEHAFPRSASARVSRDSMFSFCRLALFRLALGDIDGAHGAARRSLACFQLPADDSMMDDMLLNFAIIAARRDDPRVAARLSGFTDAWRRKMLHYPLPRGLRRQTADEQLADALSAALDPQAIDALRAEGARLTLDEAIALANTI
jgi:predicted ATPase/transcriptional regulator with XRE-family HTH domain